MLEKFKSSVLHRTSERSLLVRSRDTKVEWDELGVDALAKVKIREASQSELSKAIRDGGFSNSSSPKCLVASHSEVGDIRL